jgi:hypothetical protein
VELAPISECDVDAAGWAEGNVSVAVGANNVSVGTVRGLLCAPSRRAVTAVSRALQPP